MNPLAKLPADKALHFVGGALVATVAAVLCILAGYQSAAWRAAVIVALVAGLGKEAADYLKNRKAAKAGEAPPHGIEAWDALATALGGVTVAAPLFVVAHL